MTRLTTGAVWCSIAVMGASSGNSSTMALRNIGSLLPYHSHVDPSVVVSSLNRMIDDASVERTVFYDIYTDAQKRADLSRKDAGLFFLEASPERRSRSSRRVAGSPTWALCTRAFHTRLKSVTGDTTHSS
jgi:hypothetical protein